MCMIINMMCLQFGKERQSCSGRKGGRRQIIFFRIGYEGSIFHEQIGALGVIHVIYFHLEGNDYLSVAYQRVRG